MPTRPDHHQLLEDMVSHARKAIAFLAARPKAEFLADELSCFAVVRALEVIGEAARKVPNAIREQLPRIPWNQVVGMRHRLEHDYITVDYGIVFQTVCDDLPPLIIMVSDALSHTPATK